MFLPPPTKHTKINKNILVNLVGKIKSCALRKQSKMIISGLH